MKSKTIMFTFVVLSGFLTVTAFAPASAETPSGTQAARQAKYFCPMHPQVTSDKPGDCPICHMRLVPVNAGNAPKEHSADGVKKVLFYRHPMRPEVTSQTPDKDEMGMDYVPVYADEGTAADPKTKQLLGIRTEAVGPKELQKTVEAWGQIAHDPALYELQIDFLREDRLNYERERSRVPLAQLRSLTGQEKAAIKFLDMGLSPEWIETLRSEGVPDKRLVYHHQTNEVWAYVQLPEQDVPLVKKGDEVKIRVTSLPGTALEGRVEYLDTMIDEKSRTLRARVLVENTPSEVRPAMVLSAFIRVDLGAKLAVPEEAVLFTGKKTLVYVEENGTFKVREIVTGTKAQGYYEVLEGLNAGESVAVSGNFFIDSDSRLRASFEAEPGVSS